MTKKSAGRIERDKLNQTYEDRLKFEGIDEDSVWEHLEQAYQNARGLFGQYYRLATTIADPGTSKYFDKPQVVANLLKAVAADAKALSEETEKTYAKHKGRSGKPKDEDDHMLILMLHQDYGVLLNNHSQTILPNMLELDEHLQRALVLRGAAEAEERARDRHTVTDVESTPVAAVH